METSFISLYQKFCDDTKTSFYLNIIVIILVLVFLVGNQKTFSSHLSRLIIILLLGLAIYINIKSSVSLFDVNNIGNLLLNPSLVELRNNLLLNMLYCVLVIIFIFYLVRDFM
jgi:hypothetical protein